jgi:beta-lactamase regulating signal transducer with metallopeptidase domain
MTEAIQTVAQVASTALISSIWQGIALAAMIWVCLRLAPRTTAGVRFLIWSAVFVATALLPVISLVIGHHSVSATAVPSTSPAIVLDSRWALGIAALWASFATVRLVRLAENAFRLKSLWKSSSPVESNLGLEAVLAQPGLRGATLCTSPEIDQPCVIGFFAPRILIPSWLLECATSSELRQIVLHESAHLRRFDDWTNLIQKLLLACFPLNPALFWIERRLSAERELACDESVVRTTNAPRDYATCLTNLAERRLVRTSVVLSLGAWERRSQLAGRVQSILRGSVSLSPWRTRAVVAACMAATIGGAAKLGGSAQLISFAPSVSSAERQAFTHSAPEHSTGVHYQNVVFHPPSPATPALQNGQHSDLLSAKPLKQLQMHTRPATKNTPHRAKSSADGVQSLVIVTRWQNEAGQQMTVIDRFVRISASAAPSAAGWFFVQL